VRSRGIPLVKKPPLLQVYSRSFEGFVIISRIAFVPKEALELQGDITVVHATVPKRMGKEYVFEIIQLKHCNHRKDWQTD